MYNNYYRERDYEEYRNYKHLSTVAYSYAAFKACHPACEGFAGKNIAKYNSCCKSHGKGGPALVKFQDLIDTANKIAQGGEDARKAAIDTVNKSRIGAINSVNKSRTDAINNVNNTRTGIINDVNKHRTGSTGNLMDILNYPHKAVCDMKGEGELTQVLKSSASCDPAPPTPPSQNPESKCNNCSGPESLGKKSCQNIGKPLCEGQHAAGKAVGEAGKKFAEMVCPKEIPIPCNMIWLGIGGLFLFIFLSKQKLF
jgi:hypothetical protein